MLSGRNESTSTNSPPQHRQMAQAVPKPQLVQVPLCGKKPSYPSQHCLFAERATTRSSASRSGAKSTVTVALEERSSATSSTRATRSSLPASESRSVRTQWAKPQRRSSPPNPLQSASQLHQLIEATATNTDHRADLLALETELPKRPPQCQWRRLNRAPCMNEGSLLLSQISGYKVVMSTKRRRGVKQLATSAQECQLRGCISKVVQGT